jgi:RNA polymerase sigma factor FliA
VTGESVEELWSGWTGRRDPYARERLVVHYSPLVKFVVGRVRARLPDHVDGDDLVSDGVLGLLDALDRFDSGHGHQFQTFAVPRIRGAVMDGLRSADWMPRAARERMRAVERAEEELVQRLGRGPTVDEVAAELGNAPAEVRRGRDDRARVGCDPLDEEAAHPSPDVADDLLGEDDGMPPGLGDAISGLVERDQIVLALYYWERLTLTEIGRVLGVTESRVSQLHTRATGRLRETLRGPG